MTTTTNPILASLNRSTNAAAQSAKDGSGKVDEDPQNRFLTLLVNQLKNQDPLNPMENAEVTSQMAQISTVSGIDRLNLTLESMSSALASAQSMQAGSMIGRGVVVPGDKVDYQGGAVPLSFDLAGAAARGTVTIRDAAGQMVQTYTLDGMRAGRQTLQWDGSARVVGKAGAGEYTYDVKVRDASGATRTVASGLPASYQGAPVQLPVSGVTGERNVSVTVRNAAGATVFSRDLASLELREGAWNWGGRPSRPVPRRPAPTASRSARSTRWASRSRSTGASASPRSRACRWRTASGSTPVASVRWRSPTCSR